MFSYIMNTFQLNDLAIRYDNNICIPFDIFGGGTKHRRSKVSTNSFFYIREITNLQKSVK